MKFTYPCTTCIVNACCRIYCTEHFAFMNKIIRKFPDKMSREQIEEYYKSTPIEVKHKIGELIKDNKHYHLYAVERKSHIPRHIKVKKS